jgi:acetoacetate decarboxylase
MYGVALVSYEAPSPLTYSELLVARPVKAANGRRAIPGLSRAPRARVEITDIWVDSPDSLEGGRALWAIPKDLCDFSRTTTGRRVQRTSWSTTLDGVPIASARFTDVSRVMPRVPFKGSTWQQRPATHEGPDREVVAELKGSARALPCLGSWTFDEHGPLAWLAGKRPVASSRMADFQMSFG